MNQELIVPVAPRRFLASDRFEHLKDFQTGWYFRLWLHMAVNGGGLPLDRNLWRLAGARTEQFWTQNAAAVLACFEVREVMGKKEIYSERLLNSLAVSDKLVIVEHLSHLSKSERSHINRVRRGFVKPSLEQVKTYCEEKNKSVDPEKFWHFYESKGWLVGKAPMKNWHSAIATWEKNGDDKKQVSHAEERARRIVENTARAFGVGAGSTPSQQQRTEPTGITVVARDVKPLRD